MPTSARKSSVGGARRGPQKAHIPYRGDNPEVGKKTGIAVKHVERKSDGFEPFEEIMQQADKRTPPKPKGRKKKFSVPVLDEDLDGDGEMSMELDDSPLQYFANSRQPTTPTHSSRAGSSSRHVPRTSDVDFDKVPSPRAPVSFRKSMGRTSGPGPSRLSNSMNVRDMQSDSDPPNADYGGMEDYSPQESGSARRSTLHETSFTHLDQDDDDDDDDQPNGQDEQENEEVPSSPLRRDKGKERVLSEVPEEVEEEEEEIQQEMVSMEQAQEDEDEPMVEEEHPEPEPRRSKKVKIAESAPKASKAGKPFGKSKKENRPYREGVRRSAREHYKPLEYWRGEKLVYGRNNASGDGLVLVPPIREIVRIPKEQPEPLGKRKRPRGRSKSKTHEEPQVKYIEVPKENPEEGWDDETDTQCVVLDFPNADEVERRIALTARMVQPIPASDNGWGFMKVFGDADFIAAGVLVIPPGGMKPSKGTKDNTYVFYVIEGGINLKIHNTSMVLTTGAMFLVPRGNTYFIQNLGDRDAKIFFTQARKIAPTEAELARITTGVAVVNRDPPTRPPADVRTLAQARPSSVGASTQVEGAKKRPMSKAPAPKRAASTRV